MNPGAYDRCRVDRRVLPEGYKALYRDSGPAFWGALQVGSFHGAVEPVSGCWKPNHWVLETMQELPIARHSTTAVGL
jgi:hypothetical protein